MKHAVDYYFATPSPWSYLGHARFVRAVQAADATVRVLPINLGEVFPATGGLPLAKRAPARQAYRLSELDRWSSHLGLPLNRQPKHFPVPGHTAARLILAVDANEGSVAALALAGAVMAAVWTEERDIEDAGTLAALLEACQLPPERLREADGEAMQQRLQATTQRALDAGVFGAPSYVVDGEMFWGQDRLEFVERALQQPST